MYARSMFTLASRADTIEMHPHFYYNENDTRTKSNTFTSARDGLIHALLEGDAAAGLRIRQVLPELLPLLVRALRLPATALELGHSIFI